jgi:hypothetical protein
VTAIVVEAQTLSGAEVVPNVVAAPYSSVFAPTAHQSALFLPLPEAKINPY